MRKVAGVRSREGLGDATGELVRKAAAPLRSPHPVRLADWGNSGKRGRVEMQVLLAFDEAHRAYGDFISAAIRRARPDLEAEAVVREALEEELHNSDPYLVICSPPVPDNPVSSRVAWVELSVDPQRPSRIRLDEQRWEKLNPSLEEVLWVVDEARKLSE
jgi:hypothetical protein